MGQPEVADVGLGGEVGGLASSEVAALCGALGVAIICVHRFADEQITF